MSVENNLYFNSALTVVKNNPKTAHGIRILNKAALISLAIAAVAFVGMLIVNNKYKAMADKFRQIVIIAGGVAFGAAGGAALLTLDLAQRLRASEESKPLLINENEEEEKEHESQSRDLFSMERIQAVQRALAKLS